MIILRNDIVKTRKKHNCFGCLDDIYVGEKANYVVQKDGGAFLDSYWCEWCIEYMYKNSYYPTEDGISEGDMWEYDSYVEFRKEKTGINSLPKRFRGNE